MRSRSGSTMGAGGPGGCVRRRPSSRSTMPQRKIAPGACGRWLGSRFSYRCAKLCLQQDHSVAPADTRYSLLDPPAHRTLPADHADTHRYHHKGSEPDICVICGEILVRVGPTRCRREGRSANQQHRASRTQDLASSIGRVCALRVRLVQTTREVGLDHRVWGVVRRSRDYADVDFH